MNARPIATELWLARHTGTNELTQLQHAVRTHWLARRDNGIIGHPGRKLMNAKRSDDTSGSDWLIEEDLPGQSEAEASLQPWRILLVDDDVDVHVVTKFSLSNASFMGRRLAFLHAYSGAEALTILGNTPDIALVLLDVIMESTDAGLRVARQIRDELGNHMVRIVLRTGQPGQVMEHGIIVEYDINDFWSKTDLTTRKLFTTVISSLRTYASLQAAERHLVALKAALAQERRTMAALERHTLLMTADQNGKVAAINDNFCALLKFRREELLGRSLRFRQDQHGAILQALALGEAWAGDVAVDANDENTLVLHAMFVPLAGAEPSQHLLVATLAHTGSARTGLTALAPD